MGYVVPPRPPRVVRTWDIPPGDAGPRETVANMAAIAREEARSLPGDFRTARELRGFLADVARFVEDPPDVELVRTPRRMLDDIARQGYAEGDCDDFATLGAALALASGFDVDLVLVGLEKSGPFVHVYADVREPAGPSWTDLDVVAEQQGIDPNWTPPRVERIPISPGV